MPGIQTDGDLARDGFAIARGVLDADAVKGLRASLVELQPERAGVRNITGQIARVRSLAESQAARHLAESVLGSGATLVRSIYFDKTRDSNWAVLWHQDLTIAVQQRAEVEGYGPWSEKNGTPHVQPPAAILQSMVTLRFHLDDADETNGALLVLPRSHTTGRLAQRQVDELVERGAPAICRVAAGDVVLMRPLLLHASRKATRDARRRVLHFEYAGAQLWPPLAWAEQ